MKSGKERCAIFIRCTEHGLPFFATNYTNFTNFSFSSCGFVKFVAKVTAGHSGQIYPPEQQ